MLLNNITRDIIKLENQIPLKLVEQAFNKRFPMESPAPVQEHFENVLRVFCYQLSPILRTNEVKKKSHHEKLIRRSRHLLECLHTFTLGFEAVPFAPSGSEFNIIAREVSGGTPFFLKGKESSTKDLPSATELNRAGVKFSPTDKGLGFIRFVKEDGVLEMPALVVEDMTEIVMRNLLAYEICCTRVQRKYITRYCHFMKALIQSNEDVKVLKKEGVIFNSSGGDDKVVSLWRSLTNSTRVPYIEEVERSVEEITEAYSSGKWRRLGKTLGVGNQQCGPNTLKLRCTLWFILSISFEPNKSPLWKMPAFVVDDMIEMRNLLAYEICCTRVQRKYVNCHFMKGLIQSNEDVKVLKKQGVIFNRLGERIC